MPYYIYKIFPGKKLELVEAYEKFKDAKQHAKGMRIGMPADAGYTVKVMFAKTETEVAMLLKEEREYRPQGDD